MTSTEADQGGVPRGVSPPSEARPAQARFDFDLDFDDVSRIGGWFADNTGELSDEQIDALLNKSLDERGPSLSGG